jgi:hypothetical protein
LVQHAAAGTRPLPPASSSSYSNAGTGGAFGRWLCVFRPFF